MRKLSSLAFAAMMSVTAFATPASAQQMQATGSCGASAGNYGLTDVNSEMQSTDTQTVNALYYNVNYSGVPAPTTVGVIIRQNGELENQVGVATFTAQNSGGSFDGVIRANISPDAQGFTGSTNPANHDNNAGNTVSPGGNRAREGHIDGPRSGGVGPTGGASPVQATVAPGEYVFYVYTGSTGDVYNVKDGTVARNAFIADEKGFLGSFSCGVSTQNGSGPG
jgi:hypothetical protein